MEPRGGDSGIGRSAGVLFAPAGATESFLHLPREQRTPPKRGGGDGGHRYLRGPHLGYHPAIPDAQPAMSTEDQLVIGDRLPCFPSD